LNLFVADVLFLQHLAASALLTNRLVMIFVDDQGKCEHGSAIDTGGHAQCIRVHFLAQFQCCFLNLLDAAIRAYMCLFVCLGKQREEKKAWQHPILL